MRNFLTPRGDQFHLTARTNELIKRLMIFAALFIFLLVPKIAASSLRAHTLWKI